MTLFRFRTDGSDYHVNAYELKDTYKAFIFMYKNNQLVSIVNNNDAIELWGKVFGSYYYHIPRIPQLAELADLLIENKVAINSPEFYTVDHLEKELSSKQTTEVILNILLNPFLAASLVYIVPVAATIEAPKYYAETNTLNTFHATVDSIKLYATTQEVNTLLGAPDNQFSLNNQLVYVYNPLNEQQSSTPSKLTNSVSLGFQNNKLIWIGYYYNAYTVYKYNG